MKNIWHTPDEKPEIGTRGVYKKRNENTFIPMHIFPDTMWDAFVETAEIERWCKLSDLLALESKLAEIVTTLKDVQVFFDNFTESDLADFTTTVIRVKNTLKDIGGK